MALDVSMKSYEEKYDLYRKHKSKSKGLPRQAEVALGVPGRLRPRIFSTFSITRVAGRQPNAPAAFTPVDLRVHGFV
jgi:hypothetical protein